jgi:glycosyltransferase involved in cell wall biosynthesis
MSAAGARVVWHQRLCQTSSPTRMRALYVSHTGMSEPLGRSQVVPYLRGLSRAGWSIDVVAFEPHDATDEAIARVTAELGDVGYAWTRRSPSHALSVKLRESAAALWGLLRRALGRRPRIIHARSYLPGAVAQLAAELTPGARFVFDCRGLLGDEYADVGHWPRAGFKYRLLKRWERRLFGRADAVVTLTDRLRRWLGDEHLVAPATPVEVIPCCVDLARFSTDEAGRAESRAHLGAGDRLVLAYAGGLGTWYCEEEMARLYAEVRRRRPSLLAVYTRAPTEALRAALARAQVPSDEVRIEALPPERMPSALAGADVALALIRPCFSKMASSPVKVAESLAMGLPVVVNRGIGDLDALPRDGVVLDAGSLDAPDLARAADAIARLTPTPSLRAQARALAEREFDLDAVGVARYIRLYQRLAA